MKRLRDEVLTAVDRPGEISHADDRRPGRKAAWRRDRPRGPPQAEADCDCGGAASSGRADARGAEPKGEERLGNAADASARQVSQRVQPRSILDRTGAPPYALALFQARAPCER